eukprot:SAG22_NODE_1345_length_4675_cov_2.245629_5_plen_53_part_00
MLDAAAGWTWVAAFCRINAFKYIWRSTAHKDGADLNVRKAIWFLDRSLRQGH